MCSIFNSLSKKSFHSFSCRVAKVAIVSQNLKKKPMIVITISLLISCAFLAAFFSFSHVKGEFLSSVLFPKGECT